MDIKPSTSPNAGASAPNNTSFLAEVIVIALMPLLYGAATRLPFMYFVIHLSNHFILDWLPIGLSVAAYQGSRVLTSTLAIHFPDVSHVLGTTVGLLGYVIVLVSDEDALAPFIAGTAIVGIMSETMSSMQKYAKEMYKHHPDRKLSRLRIKFQYAFVMIGVMLGFLIGGFTYQYLDIISGVAVFGITLEGMALVAFFVFLLFKNKATQEHPPHEDVTSSTKTNQFPIKLLNEDEEDKGLVRTEESLDDVESDPLASKNRKITRSVIELEHIAEENESVLFEDGELNDEVASNEEEFLGMIQENKEEERDSLKDPGTVIDDKKKGDRRMGGRRRNSMIESISVMIKTANLTYSTCDLPPSWVNWLLCVTFGVEALTIGYTLGIGPIFILTEFNKGKDVIGVFFSIGAAFGSISAILVTCTSFGSSLLRRLAAPPFDLCFAMGGIAISVFIACVPTFAVHVIGLIALMCFNDLGATIMTELQASITTVSNFSFLGPTGQVIRRTLNVVTALTGPILFGINPRFPYYVAGSATLTWTIVLFILFKLRMEKTVEAISDKSGRNRESIVYRMSFATSEQIYSMGKR